MTEHILNFSIALDDDAIKSAVQKKAVDSIINDIKVDILNEIFTTGYYREKVARITQNGEVYVNENKDFKMFAEQIFKEVMTEYKDEIIEKASDKLVDSIRRTKKFKDVIGKVVESEV